MHKIIKIKNINLSTCIIIKYLMDIENNSNNYNIN